MLVFKINKNIVEKETKALGGEEIGMPSIQSKKIDLKSAHPPSATESKINSRPVKSSVGLSGGVDALSEGMQSY
jgi:hypothetical protein